MKTVLVKFVIFVGCLIMLFGVIGIGMLTASAASVDDLTYDIYNEQVTITDCNESASGKLIIPDTIEGYSVTSIGNWAFEGCTGLTSVTIGNGVTSIGYDAFSGCTGLTSITIPDSVTSIGEKAFEGCAGLTRVIVPDSVISIDQGAFKDCNNLKEMTLPFVGASRTATDYGAVFGYFFGFYYDLNYGEYYSGPSTDFVDRKFGTVHNDNSIWQYSCKDYHHDGNSYMYRSFYYYIPLTLRRVTVTDADKIDVAAFMNCDFITEININEGITVIGKYAFRKSGITNIIIPDSVTSIGNNSFDNCSLEYVKMGSGLTEIPSTLINKDSLKTFIIGENVTTVGGFSGCKELTSITIPDSVTSIGYNAFENCPLEYVKMGSGLTEIPSTLINKDSLKTFIIGKNVTTVGGFSDCKGLTSITIPGKVKTINSSAFSGCTGLKSITIPNSVTSIGSSAFNGCTNLATITLPENITKIGSGAFNNTAYYNNTSNWSDNVLYIGKYLIKGRTDLAGNKSVKSGTTCIADSALQGCNKIITLTVPTSVKNIGSLAFYNVTNVAYTGAATGSPWGARCLNGYTDGNFVYSDSGKAKLVACSGLATGSVVIPSSTDTIGNNAFSACSTITNIYLPVNVTRIGNSAFSGTALSDVYYEGSTVDKLGISFGDNNSRITDATWHYNSKKSDMPQATVYTLTYNANGGSGAPSKQTGNGYVTISNTKPTRSGYTFLGWVTTASATSAQYGAGSLINLDKNIALYAVWQKGNTPGNPDNPPSTDIPEANIIKGNASNNQKTYDYRTTVTFTANVPSGGKVQRYVDGKKAGTDSTLTVKESTNSYTVKVVVTDKNGNQTMDEEQITIKNGFFDKLIWFFVHLFNPGAYDVKQ